MFSLVTNHREKQPGETTLFPKKTNYTWRSRPSKQIEWSRSFMNASLRLVGKENYSNCKSLTKREKQNRVKSTTCSRAQDTLLKQLIRNESTGLVRNITKCLTIKLITRALFFCETTWYLKFKFK